MSVGNAMLAVGDKVRITNGNLFLGKWIPAGTEGGVTGRVYDELGRPTLYLINIQGKTYTIAPAEVEKI